MVYRPHALRPFAAAITALLVSFLIAPAGVAGSAAPLLLNANGEPDELKFDPSKWEDEEDKAAGGGSGDKDDSAGDDEPKQPKVDDPKRRQKVETLLTYLEGQYEKKMDSPDWISRALATISLSRSPRATAEKRLFEIMERDKHPVVKLLAWQAVLARAESLDATRHQRWLKATWPMAEKGMFNGPLRVQLLELMATAAPPPAQAKRIYGAVFDTCNAWEPQDVLTLDALGACLAAWRDPGVAGALVKRMADPDACVRAEYVLRAAGCTSKSAKDLVGPKVWDPFAQDRPHPGSTELWAGAQAAASGWLKGVRDEWKKAKTAAGDEAWKRLRPKYLPAPTPLEDIDPSDQAWRQDLELGRVNLTDFEMAFVVDATGSMGDVHAWLRRDIGKMMAALSHISTKPRMGITFYRDPGAGFVTKQLPLTGKVADLLKGMQAVTADGGGDVPEAVMDGLVSAVKQNKWTSKGRKDCRAVVLIGDAPPHAKDVKKTNELVKNYAGDGWRFHAVKVKSATANNDLSTFDGIAEAGRGESVAVEFGRITTTQFLDPAGKEIDIKMIARPEAQLLAATRPADEHPGETVMATVLASAINPQFKDRVQPLVRTLLSYCEQRPEPEKRLPFPANTPPVTKGMFKPQ